MTPELGPSARALIDAARGGAPDAAAIARMRSKIDLAVGSGAATSFASTTATNKAIVTGSSLGSTGKLGLVALAIIAATTAGVIATQRSVTSDAVSSFDPIDPPSHALHTSRESAPAPLAAGESRSAPPPATARRKPEPTATLAREVALIDRAMAALRAGDPRAALAAVRLHAGETAQRGQLAEDAAAIEIEALCTLRDPAATSRLSAFDARWPASAQRAKLSRVCR